MSRSVAASAFMGVVACVLVGLLFYVPGILNAKVSVEERQLALYQRGVRTLFQHRFQDAETIFRKLTVMAPHESEAWLVLAMAQLNQAEKGVDRALASLEKADALRPNDARVHFCRGLIYQFLERLDDSYRSFEIACQLAPWSPDAQYQQGKSLVRQRKHEEALSHFEAAVTGNPALSAAWYQLGFIYRRLGRKDDATRAQELFKALDATDRARERGLVFTELGTLAEPDPAWIPGSLEVERAKRQPSFDKPVELPKAAGPMAFVDLEFDGTIDFWTAGAKPTVWGFVRGVPSRKRAIPELTDAFGFAVGDYDVDGRPDLVVGTEDQVLTYRGVEGGGFEVDQTFDGFVDASVRLLDMDLEGDLDLVVTDAVTEPKLLINAHADGEAKPAETFLGAEHSPLGTLEARSRLLVAHDFDRDGDAECIFGNESLKYLVDNGPQWRFDMMPGHRDVPLDAGVRGLAAADLDGDGWDELISVGTAKCGIWWGKGQGRFVGEPSYGAIFTNRGVVHVADMNADGRLDVVLGSAAGSAILLNLGGRRFDLASTALPAALSFATGDVDGDHDLDLVLRSPSGVVQFLRNTTVDALPDKAEIRALRYYLGGERDSQDRRTNLHGIGARVDVLVGPHRHGRTYDGGTSTSPSGSGAQGLQPEIVITGHRRSAETVFIFWPDGVVQSEGPLQTDRLHVIDEIQRKMSSCPVLFTWDGHEYRFITDFMGGGGLGFWIGMDQYGPPDPTEVVRIAPGDLEPIDGRYRMAILEPMEEIAYIDALSAVAIDHPEGVEVYPFELFTTSDAVVPTGEPVAIRTQDRIFPSTVRDARGNDGRQKILEVDRTYVGPSRIDPTLVGYAPSHDVQFRFESVPAGKDLTLFLNGWVEYPYSRINFAASQRGDQLEPPSFSWRRTGDEPWTVLHRQVGYPAGMPKTMVLPLDGVQFAPGDGFELKIATNMEIYWDQVFVAPRAEVTLHVQPLTTETALLRFGGYPREYSDDGALPPTYHYSERDAYLPYEPMPGLVTRYGDVRSLIGAVDDRFAIVGGGDEIWLEFLAPDQPAGTVRTVFLDTHGYCKDLDPLTAACDSVDPLPFETMTTYPPLDTDVAPDRRQYIETFNTRRD